MNVGDRVRIKNLDEIKIKEKPAYDYKDVLFSDSYGLNFVMPMTEFCGKVDEIIEIDRPQGHYCRLLNSDWYWSAEWVEPIMEMHIKAVTENEMDSLLKK